MVFLSAFGLGRESPENCWGKDLFIVGILTSFEVVYIFGWSQDVTPSLS